MQNGSLNGAASRHVSQSAPRPRVFEIQSAQGQILRLLQKGNQVHAQVLNERLVKIHAAMDAAIAREKATRKLLESADILLDELAVKTGFAV